jgi:hypothetical protein
MARLPFPLTADERALVKAQARLDRAVALSRAARAERDRLMRAVIDGGRNVLEMSDNLGITRLSVSRAYERQMADVDAVA